MKPAAKTVAIVPLERIQQVIYLLRGTKVVLSNDLAVMYQVEPRALVQAVKRNPDRFPKDFMFQLTRQEWAVLKSQIVISNPVGRGGARTPPYAFTEQGVAMLSSVLNSPRAVAVNVQIMRAFVRLRELLVGHAELARKLAELEQKYDRQFKVVFDAIRELMANPQDEPKPPIGFSTEENEPRQRARLTSRRRRARR